MQNRKELISSIKLFYNNDNDKMIERDLINYIYAINTNLPSYSKLFKNSFKQDIQRIKNAEQELRLTGSIALTEKEV